jgi:tRNA pseudouridine32 synthase/23S rRNA pseudouridine746 synthase
MIKFHPFNRVPDKDSLPDKFTNPFDYQPHPLCIEAAECVQSYLATQTQWSDELSEGKMFGVLVVQNQKGETGYLAAFSGNIAHCNNHAFFVPPIYDLLNPTGFFVKEEAEISAINRQIENMEEDTEYQSLKKRYSDSEKDFGNRQTEAKENYKRSQIERNRIRQSNPDKALIAEITRQSQFQKAEIKRLIARDEETLNVLRKQIEFHDNKINGLKNKRKTLSFELQKKLFNQFVIVNAKGERKGLTEIFEDSTGKLPPAGAGECAAPKILQYAYINKYKPVAMAEFWWGKSPKQELRRHGYFYPACKNKCKPILNFMLQGIDLQDEIIYNVTSNEDLEIVFEDDFLMIVNKPPGMLSVPGKTEKPSVYSILKEKISGLTGPVIVHRLDMDTSGLMIIAKNEKIYRILQNSFLNNEIKKTYIAVVEGIIKEETGIITLPLCLDIEDRPRQTVNYKYGKAAVTKYEVLKRLGDETLVAFYPETGRTHQLRLHAAHPDGLNAPIKGDRLYGKSADRLFLHAQKLELMHPVTGKTVRWICNPPFFYYQDLKSDKIFIKIPDCKS